MNASRANTISRINSDQEKLRMAKAIPATIGMNHKGTMTGMCFLNFSLKRLLSFFLLSLAAMRPYPQGQFEVFQREQ